jgi:hypothetical protein
VHHARVAEQAIELLLRDRDEADVEDVSEKEDEDEIQPLVRSAGASGIARRMRP